MSDNVKRLELGDILDATRECVSLARPMGEHKLFHTEVTMRDDSGRVIFDKRANLIVLRGRTFTLEKIFDDVIGSTGITTGQFPYKSDNARKVMAFMVGKGGAPAGDPFAPSAPAPSNLWLTDPVPFRLHDTNASANGDPLTFIPSGERANYGGGAAVGGQPTQTRYFHKLFDVRTPVWFFNDTQNTVYKQIKLSISKTDCRTSVTNMINELGLLFTRTTANDANSCPVLLQPEIFSRICFPTEFLPDNKALDIDYKVYA